MGGAKGLAKNLLWINKCSLFDGESPEAFVTILPGDQTDSKKITGVPQKTHRSVRILHLVSVDQFLNVIVLKFAL